MALRRKVIRAIVKDLLRENNIMDSPIPVEKIAKTLNLKLSFQPFEGDLSGCIVRDGNSVVVGINSLHHENRQRFTLAHEIGHFLLHKGERTFIDRGFRVNLRDTESSKSDNTEEIEANYFAAELLMPEHLLIDDLEDKLLDIEDDEIIRELAEQYRVSPQALTYRLVNLGYLTP